MKRTNNRQIEHTQKNKELRPERIISLASLLEGNDEDLLTVQEVAATCRVNDTTARRWIKNGALPAVPLFIIILHGQPLPHRGRRSAHRVKRGELRRILTPKLFSPM